jgi:hypothetical protein
MSVPPSFEIPDAPMGDVQRLREAFPDLDVNLELQGVTWVFTARGKDGADPWFLSSANPARFTNALRGNGFRE